MLNIRYSKKEVSSNINFKKLIKEIFLLTFIRDNIIKIYYKIIKRRVTFDTKNYIYIVSARTCYD